MPHNKQIKLAIICTHPIQYYAPVFKLLAKRINLKVFYTAGKNNHYDAGFKQHIQWDIPLLSGYTFEFLTNTARQPGSHHFMGIKNPDAIEHITDFKATHIIIYGWAYYSHLKIIRHFKRKVQLSFRGDSNLLNEKPGLKSLVKKHFLKWIYKKTDHAFYAGTNNKAYFKNYGLKDQQLIFTPHAIDNKRFNLKKDNRLREYLQISDMDILILYAGKFHPLKNPLLLLQAFLDLNIKGIHLLFAGGGILENELKDKSLHHQNIHFLPFQNQKAMPSVYQACDLFCLPSKSESWGLSVNEAMAAGKAVLVSDKAGCATDLVKLKNGRIFKSNNLSDLKINLKALTTSRYDLNIKGAVSKQLITGWNFETQVKNILSALS